jgi:hypothetical protein
VRIRSGSRRVGSRKKGGNQQNEQCRSHVYTAYRAGSATSLVSLVTKLKYFSAGVQPSRNTAVWPNRFGSQVTRLAPERK